MRGEKRILGFLGAGRNGSPPHARGKGTFPTLNAVLFGITPACAGKSGHHGNAGHWLRDHPRMRGEKGRSGCSRAPHRGSPPHARGKGSSARAISRLCGITPACAGKSQAAARQASGFRDHPRMRGEKGQKALFRVANTGSPPHARGKVQVRAEDGDRRRITPACAGKSTIVTELAPSVRDHPRVRGEKLPSPSASISTAGSPPRARGKDLPDALAACGAGITPACAGKRAGRRP